MSFPRYPAYKDSGVEWLGEVPEHWGVDRFDTRTRSHRESVDPGVLRGRTVFHYSIPAVQETGTGLVEEGDEIDSNKLVIRETQLLVSKLNPHKQTTVVARMQDGLLTVASSEFVPLVPTAAKLDYIRYVWESQYCRDVLLSRCDSATRSHQRVAPSDITKMLWAWPDDREQTAIAAFLDREIAKIDALIAEQEQLIELLKEKRQAVISHAVTKGLDPDVPMKDSGVEWLGEVPAHWETKRLRHVSPEITVGVVVEPSKYYVDEGVPALRSLNVTPGGVALENLVFISAEANEVLSKSKLRAGDLVAVRSGQPGTTALVPEELDGCNCIDLIVIRKPNIGSEHYLCWYLASDAARRQFTEGSGGAIQQHFNIGTAMNLVVTVPEPKEQDAIARFLESECAKIDSLTEEATHARQILKERRVALISAAVTGQIDVRDAAAEGIVMEGPDDARSRQNCLNPMPM